MKAGEKFINQVVLYLKAPWRGAVGRLAVIWGTEC